jgi:hypothetical protein
VKQANTYMGREPRAADGERYDSLVEDAGYLRSRRNLLAQQWCPGAELNHRHLHFQCSALPTELPGRRTRRTAGGRARGVINARFRAVQTSWRRVWPHMDPSGRWRTRPLHFASSSGIVGAILDEVRGEADKVSALAVPRSRRHGYRMHAATWARPRTLHGRINNHLSRSRIRDEYDIDYDAG